MNTPSSVTQALRMRAHARRGAALVWEVAFAVGMVVMIVGEQQNFLYFPGSSEPGSGSYLAELGLPEEKLDAQGKQGYQKEE